MADEHKGLEDVAGPSEPEPGETREEERERVRSSNDRDQELEREGIPSRHNRGYDEAVRKPRGSV